MVILPAILDTFSSLKDKTLKLVFHSNELTPEQLLGVVKNVQKFGFLAFKEESFKEPELDVIKDLDVGYRSKEKSKSKRLRNVLFVLSEQDDKGFKTFNDYYNFQMEEIINHFKNKIDE